MRHSHSVSLPGALQLQVLYSLHTILPMSRGFVIKMGYPLASAPAMQFGSVWSCSQRPFRSRSNSPDAMVAWMSIAMTERLSPLCCEINIIPDLVSYAPFQNPDWAQTAAEAEYNARLGEFKSHKFNGRHPLQ